MLGDLVVGDLVGYLCPFFVDLYGNAVVLVEVVAEFLGWVFAFFYLCGGELPHVAVAALGVGFLCEEVGALVADDGDGFFYGGGGGAVCFLWVLGWVAFLEGFAVFFEWAGFAVGLGGCADAGAEFHDGLVVVAWAGWVDEACCEFLEPGACSGCCGFLFLCEEAAEYAGDVGVDGWGGDLVGDAGYCACDVGAYSGEEEEFADVFWDFSCVFFGYFLCCEAEVAGACVISESCPGAEDVLFVAFGERLDGWEGL